MPDDELFRTIRTLYAEALDKEPEDVGYLTDFFLEEGGTSLDFLTLLWEARIVGSDYVYAKMDA